MLVPYGNPPEKLIVRLRLAGRRKRLYPRTLQSTVTDAASPFAAIAACGAGYFRCPSAPCLDVYRILAAADRLTNAALWLVAHMTYAARIDPTGTPLRATNFKLVPEGYTGGSLNMVPAYVDYLAAVCMPALNASKLSLGQIDTDSQFEYVSTK